MAIKEGTGFDEYWVLYVSSLKAKEIKKENLLFKLGMWEEYIF